jgi:hypothetical protein
MGSITDSSIFCQILIGISNFMFLLMALKALLALSLNIVHSFVEVTCGADVQYSLCAVGQQCLDGICICGPGDWTFFGTPLFLSY